MRSSSDRDDGLILIRGAGDLASGVAWRLFRCGFPVVMTELPQPLMVRRMVCFGEAVYTGVMTVEGVTARLAVDAAAARQCLTEAIIPVIVDPTARCRHELAPNVLVDGVMAKRNTGLALTDAALVVALGPGFTAGVDCHVVVETNRGHRLGRTIWQGQAEPDTGTPGEVGGRRSERVLRASESGVIMASAQIGDRVVVDQVVATVASAPVRAPIDGILRGMLHDGVVVPAGMKIGDIDPRGMVDHCYTLSDKSLAVAGGVLEAILQFWRR